MLKRLLATTALSAILATAAAAQEAAPDAPPADEPPVMLEDPLADPAEPDVAEDPLADPADPDVAEDPLADPAEPEVAEDPLLADEPVDIATIQAEDLIGADVLTFDDEKIADVDDIVLTPEGELQSLVVTFGGFLGFGTSTVEMMPEEIEIFRDEQDNLIVRTDITPEALETRPEFEG